MRVFLPPAYRISTVDRTASSKKSSICHLGGPRRVFFSPPLIEFRPSTVQPARKKVASAIWVAPRKVFFSLPLIEIRPYSQLEVSSAIWVAPRRMFLSLPLIEVRPYSQLEVSSAIWVAPRMRLSSRYFSAVQHLTIWLFSHTHGVFPAAGGGINVFQFGFPFDRRCSKLVLDPLRDSIASLQEMASKPAYPSRLNGHFFSTRFYLLSFFFILYSESATRPVS
jgi:hypothetical protein